jgi:hypothetical protein
VTPPLNLPAPGRCQAIFVILTISHSHMFLVNSRLGHFSAPASPRDPLSLSYGVNLPSSLAVIHSSASGYSPHPPVSVYGTGGPSLSASRFSREHDYPRCRLVTSWGWSRFQGFGCSPIKVARELGSERRETVRSLSVVGVGSLRRSGLSTRGPGRTNLWSTGCGASRTAGYPRSVRISAESI